MKIQIPYQGFKIVIRYLANYKKDLIALSFLGVASALTNGAVPYLAGRFFDAILEPAEIFKSTSVEMPLWLFFIILWLIIRLISDMIDWKIKLESARMDELVHSDYMINAFKTLLELPVGFHKDKKMGQITDRIGRAAGWLSRIVGDVLIALTPQFLSIFVALIFSFYVNYFMAIILLLAIFIYVLLLAKMAPSLARLQRKSNRAYNRAYADAYDAIFNVAPIKQAVGEKHERRKIFINFRLKASKIWIEMMAIWQGMNFYQRLIVTATQFIIYGLAIYFIHQGAMTLGELVMFSGYATMLFGPFIMLGHNWQVVQNGLISIERAEKILKTPPEIYVPENAVVLSDIKGEVEFKNVYFSYKRGKQVLENINFKVKPGEIIALVGESGVGKSTLIDLISGYYFATNGNVYIDNHNVKNFDLNFLRSKIAVVPQEVVLFNDTIEKNIKYGNFGASIKAVKKAAEMSHCLEFIEKFSKKWNQIVGERGVKLSVGQKQRVAIGRAILRKPRILILDEPTSALDAKSENIIAESLEELMKDRTTFIIAHRLSTVRKADRILVLDKGKIAEEGRHEELIKIKNGIYQNLYKLQIGLGK
ncbi:MAG: ATP-binding cassette, sub-family B [Candidatus Wolfebacteria bacterium GW2011_GWC1_37_10]|uniref:ATP-binding cassette, sub-family B n=1 Tax=Candidatus Wolfebacteria bacterium GW2011_GWC1_37_10 TaxID=1619010 RepID=A0A0G0J0S7_9BACT|nr:MAG: ATP-binding cassette, sub-family B [Candidatus Wolfebacteria bacterium GW2011_GWC1_37_10]